MASMEQIVVKITGQDNLSNMLAKIAKNIENVNKSGKKLSTNFTTNLKTMEKHTQTSMNRINRSLNQANKLKFHKLSQNFSVKNKQMEKRAKTSVTNINRSLNRVNKLKFNGLSREFGTAAKIMEKRSKTAGTNIPLAFGPVNHTQFKPLATNFQATTETMEILSKTTATDIGAALAHVNGVQFSGLSGAFKAATETMETLSKTASAGIGLDFEQINKIWFGGLATKFDTVTKGMERSAKTATRNISSNFNTLGTAIASIGIGMGARELFDIGKERTVTAAMLRNRFGDAGQGFLDEYYKYTKISSTPDFQVNRLFRGVLGAPGVTSKNVSGLLKASDALSTTGDVDDYKLRLALMDFMSTGGYKRLTDDFGSDTAKWLGGRWELAQKKKDPTIIQNAMEDLAKHLGRMSPEGEAITTTFEGEMGAYNKTLATIDSIVQNAGQVFNSFLQTVISPAIDLFNKLDTATGGFLSKLAGGGVTVLGFVATLGVLGNTLGFVKNGLEGIFGKKHKLDMDCGVCPPGTVLGGQGVTTGKNSKSKGSKGTKSTKVKGRLGGTGRSLGMITRLSGRAGTALRSVASAVGLLAAAETAAAIAGSAMFLPIIAGAAVAAVAIYALTEGMRANADTMKNYNDAMKNGEKRVNDLKQASTDYAKKEKELIAEKKKLAAAGKDVGYIEKEIADAHKKSANAAKDAAIAEKALNKAREEHKRISTESTKDDVEYADHYVQMARESGRYSEAELETLDKQNAALKDGTAVRQYGLEQKMRLHAQGDKFVEDIYKGNNPQSEAWLKNKKAMDEYHTGMDSLAKLEEDYMHSDSWIDKGKIWIEQGITKMQLDSLTNQILNEEANEKLRSWVGNGVKQLNDWGQSVQKTAEETSAWVNGALGNIGKFFGDIAKGIDDFGKWINNPGNIEAWFGNLFKPLTDAWNNTGAWIKGAWGNTVKWVKDSWNKITQPIINTWNNYVVKPLIGTYNWIKAKWHETLSWLKQEWDKYIQPIIDGAKHLENTVRPVFENIAAAANKVIDPLKSIYCTIMGCSPGLIPAFKSLGREVPRQIGKTLPHLEALSNAMNIPSTSLEISTIPTLDSSALNSLDVPLTMPDGGYSASSKVMSSVSTIYNDHNHYHEPITINAKDMSRSEFQSILVSVLEEGNRRYVPP